jgi:hypothetical protein
MSGVGWWDGGSYTPSKISLSFDPNISHPSPLPTPPTQLPTHSYSAQATNLAVKGVASIAAYGYIVEKYTGNVSAAEEAYATAAAYAKVMVQYSWNNNGTDSHFMIGYVGSQKDGGDPQSWPMLYNALWLRILGFEDLVPQTLLDTQRDWYAANVMQQYGLPLNSRKLYTKDDWMTFLAATCEWMIQFSPPLFPLSFLRCRILTLFFTRTFTPNPPHFYLPHQTDYTPGPSPVPSPFSNTLFHGLFTFANETTSREALSDWTNTDSPTAVGFTNRPVYGAMWAPVLVTEASSLGLGRAGNPRDASLERAAAIFAEAWKDTAY